MPNHQLTVVTFPQFVSILMSRLVVLPTRRLAFRAFASSTMAGDQESAVPVAAALQEVTSRMKIASEKANRPPVSLSLTFGIPPWGGSMVHDEGGTKTSIADKQLHL